MNLTFLTILLFDSKEIHRLLVNESFSRLVVR